MGDVYGPSVYVSTHRALLGQLQKDLYLVTVRGDRLWWVGTLRSPKHDGKCFRAKADTSSIVDITSYASKLVFANGKGMQLDKMAMSLQTPRVLSHGDVALLESLRGKKKDKTSPRPAPEKKPQASTSGAQKTTQLVLTKEDKALAGLKDLLRTKPNALDVVMSDVHAQLPLVVQLLTTGTHAATHLRLAAKGFDPVKTATVGRDAIKQPIDLGKALPKLERLILVGHEFFRKIKHLGLKELEMDGMSIAVPWVKDSFPALQSLRWSYPTDMHGVASGPDVVLPLFEDSPFPKLTRLDLSNVDLDSEESLDEMPEVVSSQVWKQLEHVHLPGQKKGFSPKATTSTVQANVKTSSKDAVKKVPPPKLPLRLEVGQAAITLDTNSFERTRVHRLAGREKDANILQLAQYLKEAKPEDIEHVYLEIDPEAFVKSGPLAKLAAALALLPNLRRLSVKETPVSTSFLAALVASKSLRKLDLLRPSFTNDASYAALQPLFATLTDVWLEHPGKPMSLAQAKVFVAAAAKSSTLKSLRVSVYDAASKGAENGAVWSKVFGKQLESLHLDIDLGAAGIATLMQGVSKTVRHLGFGYSCKIDAAAAHKLAAFKGESLAMEGVMFEDGAAVRTILQKIPSLRHLVLDMDAGYDDDNDPNAKSPKPTRKDNLVNDLATGIRANKGLESLRMPNTYLRDADTLVVAKAIGAHKSLKTLALSFDTKNAGNQKQVVAALAPRLTAVLPGRYESAWFSLGMLRQGKLTNLDISGYCEDIEKNLPAIYEAAAKSKTLERFAAASEQHKGAAPRAIVNLIERSPTLRHLDIRGCGLSDSDLVRVLKAAAKNPRLESLGVAEHDPGASFIKALEAFDTSRIQLL